MSDPYDLSTGNKGYRMGEPYTLEQQLHDQKQKNKGLENRIRKELEPYTARLFEALKQIADKDPYLFHDGTPYDMRKIALAAIAGGKE